MTAYWVDQIRTCGAVFFLVATIMCLVMSTEAKKNNGMWFVGFWYCGIMLAVMASK